jgi:hypothetical protein
MAVKEISISQMYKHFNRIITEIEKTGVEVVVIRAGGRTMRTGPVVKIIRYDSGLPDPDSKSK